MNKNVFKSKCKINDIGVTNDTLAGRSVKYLSSVEIYPLYILILTLQLDQFSEGRS